MCAPRPSRPSIVIIPSMASLGGALFMILMAVPPSAALVAGASLPHASWTTLHVDDQLLVVDKGNGLLTVPGVGEAKQDSLLSRVRSAGYADVSHAAHRLDRDTSGIVALGRTAAAHKSLSTQFQQRTVSKRYSALVLGWPRDDEGTVDAPVGKVRLPGEQFARMRVVGSEADGARQSLTRWRVLERTVTGTSEVAITRVELEPVTGRSQQLRLHMRHIGHPILGDELHGCDDAIAAAPRLCLHACALEFRHPASGAPMRVASAPTF